MKKRFLALSFFVSFVCLFYIALAPRESFAESYAYSSQTTVSGVTFTAEWNDAAAGEALAIHMSATGGSGDYQFRMDPPEYSNPGENSYSLIADSYYGSWNSYSTAGETHDFSFTPQASGDYKTWIYCIDKTNNVWYARVQVSFSVQSSDYPSLNDIYNDAISQCKSETNGSDYDVALWLHDWVINRFDYDYSLQWDSEYSGLLLDKGTCESYQRIYASLLNRMGIENARMEGNGHTWNAVKIDGQWYQIDPTWDDAEGDYYAGVDDQHLFFALTDELMALAHSDHTATYTADGYKYRSTDLRDNFIVRSGEAAGLASAYASTIQEHLDNSEVSFTLPTTTTASNHNDDIINSIVAYQIEQASWNNAAGEVKLTCNYANSTFTFEAQYADAPTVHEPTIAEGVYTITSALSPYKVVDIANGSKKNCGNAQLWISNFTAAQRYKLIFDKNTGYYEIVNMNSGLALDVSGGVVANGRNVQQYARNDTLAQRWLIIDEGNNCYSVRSALDDTYVLDVASASTKNGANIQIYKSNGTNAQRWNFVRVDNAAIPDDTYTLTSALSASKVVDISSGSKKSGANVQLWDYNGTGAQKFTCIFDTTTGLYEILNANSGLALDVSGASCKNGSNVQQYARNGTMAQRWQITKTSNGHYTIRSALNPSYVLDVSGASTKNGANIQIYQDNGSKAQKWSFKS